MRAGATSQFTRSHPFAPESQTPFLELPTDSELHETRGVTGCNLVTYEVAPVHTPPNIVLRTTRIPITVPPNYPLIPEFAELEVRPGATLYITRSHPFAPESQTPFPELPPSSQQFPSPATGRVFRVLNYTPKEQFQGPATKRAFHVLSLYSKKSNFKARPLNEHSAY